MTDYFENLKEDAQYVAWKVLDTVLAEPHAHGVSNSFGDEMVELHERDFTARYVLIDPETAQIHSTKLYGTPDEAKLVSQVGEKHGTPFIVGTLLIPN